MIDRVGTPLFEGGDWNFELIRRLYDAVEDVDINEMKLDGYTNQIEVITAEPMLEAYTSEGVTPFSQHLSLGQAFLAIESERKIVVKGKRVAGRRAIGKRL